MVLPSKVWLLIAQKPVGESCSVVSDSLRLLGLYSPWNFPGQNTGVGIPLQGYPFPSPGYLQGLNPGLQHWRRILYQLSHQGSTGKTNIDRKESCFNQNASSLGRWWTQCPPKTLPWKLLKGNRDVISVGHWDGESKSSLFPACAGLCASLSSSYNLSLDAILFSQSVRLPKGKLGKRSDYLLITYPSFLLWSVGKKQ